ncbi:MAG: hypothetical protein ACFFCS_17595 [Candidatus Hodarchaeota archaeon]
MSDRMKNRPKREMNWLEYGELEKSLVDMVTKSLIQEKKIGDTSRLTWNKKQGGGSLDEVHGKANFAKGVKNYSPQ